MSNYILQGWGDKNLWMLNDATWDMWLGHDAMKIIAQGGYGERIVSDTQNKNWVFMIGDVMPVGETQIEDVQIFLEGDSNPIIFRYGYNDPSGYLTFYIIYNGDIKASKTIDVVASYGFKILRIGSVYHFLNLGPSVNLLFDYGLFKKPVKLKLVGVDLYGDLMWWLGYYADDDKYLLKWYYTEEDYAFIT